MKIGSNAPASSPSAAGAVTTGTRSGTSSVGQGSRTAESGGSSTVKLSSTARALLDGADGSFDAEKVNRVRQSISDGTYKINADVIADKLIANAHEVLGKVNGTR
ncbi:MAG: flagellar biosynthesis anti-sigma factor FlgM [Leptothrix sp. (in: b-proteobacteria)]